MGENVDSRSRTSRPIAVLAVLAAAIAIVTLVVRPIRVANQQARSATNLKGIGTAMRLYHDAYQRFPADIRGQDGASLLSWRVRILPFLGMDSLFAKFRLDEPWDSPHNKALLERMPAVYALPGGRATPGMTFYRGFSGHGTLFDPAVPQGVDLAGIKDGASNTIAVVEARDAVPWTRPDTEIPYTDEMNAIRVVMPWRGESRNLAEQLHGKIDWPEEPEEPEAFKPLREALGDHYAGGSNALYCDGTVRRLPDAINLAVLRALVTRNRFERVSADAF